MGAARELDQDIAEFTLADGTLKLLQVIESTPDEAVRLSAISSLAQTRTRDAGRILVETFERCLWRETKIAVIRALGTMRLSRTTEFLIDLASSRDDLGLAAEAVLALGATAEPIAGEYLVSVLEDADHPLQREAVIALGAMPEFPCDAALDALWERPSTQGSPTLKQHLLLALARRGHERVWPRVKALLDPASPEGPALFNAALIAASQCGGSEALGVLRGLDTRYRYFAHQLRLVATERLELRLARRVEDAVEALLNAALATTSTGTTTPAFTSTSTGASADYAPTAAVGQALQYLREFPVAEAWEAYKVLGSMADPGTDVRVRAALYDPKRKDEDKAVLVANWDVLDWAAAAALARQHAAHHKNFADQLARALSPERAIALFMRLREPKAGALLSAFAADATLPAETRVKAVNALVAQAKMSPAGAPAIAEHMLERLRAENAPEMKARLVRALGQIRHDGGPFLIALAAMLKEETVDRASVYAALARIGSDEAARVVLRRFAKISAKADAAPEIRQAVCALARLTRFPDGEEAPVTPKDLWEPLTPPLLTLLAKTGQPAYAPLVEKALQSKEFSLRLMGSAAARHTASPKIQDLLLASLSDDSPSVAGRALDSLCAKADITGHRRLLAWIAEPARTKAQALKVARSLRPDPKNAASLLREVDQLLKKAEHAFADGEVRDAAVNLRDNLQMLAGAAPGRTARSAATPSHALDNDLAAFVRGYPGFSETVKTVLRNAELTYKHTDLFDDRVDKSTMIVEYVKSIDILLQERFGAAIFLDQQPQLLPKMQSRIVQLQLDDESNNGAQLVRDLQCGLHFPPESFPAHKMTGIARSIVSGKIVRDQYAVIDGLRAWGLLLLVFGRKFKFRQIEVEPLLKVADAGNASVSELAAEMNALQDLRNQAAHRATMLQSVKLAEVRAFSFKVLNAVAAVLG